MTSTTTDTASVGRLVSVGMRCSGLDELLDRAARCAGIPNIPPT